MSKPFSFTLSTPDATLFDGEIEAVSFPTPLGEITVLADHEPLVSLVSSGIITIKTKAGEKTLGGGSGFVRISREAVKAFIQAAEYAESIDEQKALEGKKRAEALMREKVDEATLADASAALERSIAMIKAVERKKKRTRSGQS